jgi:hypothetical protein
MDKLDKLHHKNFGQTRLHRYAKHCGQGIIEVIVGVGIIVLVLGGVVVLMVRTMGAKNKSFDRIKATEFAQVLMEEKVSEAKNQQDTFWSKVGAAAEAKTGSDPGYGYPEFTGTITTTKVSLPEDVCAPDPPKCAKVVVSITWLEKVDQTITFERFFAKN